MSQTTRATGGAVVAPHHLAAQAGQRVLRDGGNAIEAMVAAAAAITVVYPHMNALGGDNFWLIHSPGGGVVGIDACGGAAAKADIGYYRSRGHSQIPSRGPLAALTVGGAVSGWQAALRFSAEEWGGELPLDRLLQDAIDAPRWLLGRTWGSEITSLRIENRLDAGVIDALRNAGHDVEVVGPFEEFMGHAGALVRHPSGLIEGASDPRGDGAVAAF